MRPLRFTLLGLLLACTACFFIGLHWPALCSLLQSAVVRGYAFWLLCLACITYLIRHYLRTQLPRLRPGRGLLALLAYVLLCALPVLSGCSDDHDWIMNCPYECCTCNEEPGGHGHGVDDEDTVP